MYMQAILIFVSAVGLPGNLLLIYTIASASEKIAAYDIFFMHFTVANMLQLITRIPALIVPYHDLVCYPMSVPCKVSVFILFCSKKASIWITFMLYVFHLLKLTNKNGFLSSIFLKKPYVQLYLALNWLIWIAAGVPYPSLVPSDRLRQSRVHMNTSCFCSVIDALTEKDLFLKNYDIVFGTVFQVLAIFLMCLVDIKILWIVRKHKQAVVPHATSQGQRNHQREVNAIKVLTSLVVFFVICHLIETIFRNYRNEFTTLVRRMIEHLYPAVSPIILGCGDQRFRKKIMCIMFCRPCQTTSVKEVITVS